MNGSDSVFGGESSHKQSQLTVGCHPDGGPVHPLHVLGGTSTATIHFYDKFGFFHGSPVAWDHKAKWEAVSSRLPFSVTGHLISRGLAGSLGFDGRLAANTYFDLRGLGFDPLGEDDLQHTLVTVGAHLSRIH